MALTFPRTDILTGLDFSPQTEPFKPMWRQEVSRTAGGVTIVKNIGPLLWKANYATIPIRTAEAGEVEADLLSLQGGVKTFEGYDPRHPLPASDKVSALTGVTVSFISPNMERMQIIGVPVGFVLTKGDWISVDDGVNLNLLKVVETKSADGTGEVAQFTVAPFVPVSISVGDPVTLRYPCARWMIDKDSVQRVPASALHERIVFSATQVIE
ncbi:hypothetical protein QO034_18830 [Sedimentitalea sp. JM2-8]|uniref:Uncharacterized protein n=1 Tax=Sedimentitalea xiamensis TaxID=3050037 RepID=A0ABT7FJ76_9RHOB|nr:hypothetical protein [Sedimentitalea xiamensis]MDK3075147.1 hypothetical protein [Sedimentitalea xiamensis]